MDFKPFDHSKMDKYAAEAKAKWGKTDAYQEFEKKTAGQTKEQLVSTGDKLMDIFREFGALRQLPAGDPQVQALVAKLQSFITANYYNCTNQILRGLGQMYIAGDEMTDNINRAGGEGTAQFAHDAIEIYCN